MRKWVFLLLASFLVCSPSHSNPVLSGQKNEQQETDEDVKELESLRTENHKTNSTIAGTSVVQPADTSIQPTASPKTEDEGEPMPNSRSAIFRHRGITEAKKNRYWNDKTQQIPSDGYSKFAGIQYSPADLAAYVFNTGDEEGVAVAVEKLVREGMMGRTDAINYLQDVKQILGYMRDQFEQRKKTEEFRERVYLKPQASQILPNSLREQFAAALETEKRDSKKPVETSATPIVTTEHPNQAVIASTSESKVPSNVISTTARPKSEDVPKESFKDDDFKRHSLERPAYGFNLDVIYKLAKDMFTQSILRDDPTAEETLSGLVTFLESEVENKRISPAMKEKVLEIVSAALVDSLRESQDLLSENQAQSFEDGGSLYQHLAGANRPSMGKIPMSEMYRKLRVKGPENMLQLSSNSNRPKSS